MTMSLIDITDASDLHVMVCVLRNHVLYVVLCVAYCASMYMYCCSVACCTVVQAAV